MSFKMRIVRQIVKVMSRGMFNGDQIDVMKVRQKLEKAYAQHQLEPGVTMKLVTYNGVEVAIFTPDELTSDHIVYYLHGGGLVTGDRLTAGPYSSQLALATGCKVVSCSYRLAPEDPYPASVDDSYGVYQYLMEHNPDSKVSFIGESGGAYLSLVVALKARDEQLQLPSAVVLNSIPADMSGTIERVDSRKETTVTVAGMKALAEMYAPQQDLRNPYISPIHADYAGLPPLRIVYDRDELLAFDSKLVAEKAKAAGVMVEVAEYKNCFHAFTTTGKDTPESAKELAESARFMLASFHE